MSDIRSDSAYADGFEDALDFTPLYEDASEAYRTGWQAAHTCKELLAHYDFTETGRGQFSKTMTLSSPQGKDRTNG